MTGPKGSEPPPLDVYALPFVPQVFRLINQAAADVKHSAPVRSIDFGKYVQSFAGTSFLHGSSAITSANEHDPNTSVKQERNGIINHNCEQTPTLQTARYEDFFRAALAQESAALQRLCDKHALYRVPLQTSPRDPRPNVFTLQVPGLREMSLPIEVGDIVQLRQLRFGVKGEALAPVTLKFANGSPAASHPTEVQYNAVVLSVDRRNEILWLRVDHLGRISMFFNACLTVQSRRIGALNRAVAVAAEHIKHEPKERWLRSMLFPESSDGYLQKTLNRAMTNLGLSDQQLNYEQVKAVNTVLNETYGAVPFIISGPPGTGKTKTIVELALQQTSKNTSEHLLVCAPSDPAADTLVHRLSKHLGPSDLLRINSPARSFPEVSDKILPYCCVDDGVFSLPQFRELMSRRIVVTTCRDADVLIQARVSNSDLFMLESELLSALHPGRRSIRPALHWTGLLIDEAAQAVEPEALISLNVVAPPVSHTLKEQWPIVVMAGDQHQLGPRTASKSDAMQTSLFERLLRRPFYNEHPLARSRQNGGIMRPLTQDMLPILRPAFANLIRNYRSHPTILATPSLLFYNDTLEPESTSTDTLTAWPGWKQPGWPILFRYNHAPDEIERDGGGWYNVVEAKVACQYARSFLQSNLVSSNDICIMSPFHAQVKVIRSIARQNGMSGVNIGPLEAFQGLESRLVILCTTRTRDRFIDQDLAKGLGVIHEPRRFNVALTRAKEGLIVIGNSDVLKQDEKWASFLAFCARNNLTEGADMAQQVIDSGDMAVSRLEKQFLRRPDDESAHDSGIRKLGFVEDADQALWRSGVALEHSIRDGEEIRDM